TGGRGQCLDLPVRWSAQPPACGPALRGWFAAPVLAISFRSRWGGSSALVLGCPFVGPKVQWQNDRQKRLPHCTQLVPSCPVLDDLGIAQLLETAVEHAWIGLSGLLQRAKCEGPFRAGKFPKDSKCHPAPQEIKQDHNRAA